MTTVYLNGIHTAIVGACKKFNYRINTDKAFVRAVDLTREKKANQIAEIVDCTAQAIREQLN